MSEIKPPKSSQNWQTSIDRRLQERLLRPMVKPGVIDSTSLARKILSRYQRLGNRIPLLDQLEQRWSSLRELPASQVPVVYAQSRQTEEVTARSEGISSINSPVNTPVSKPVQTPIFRAKLISKVDGSDTSGMPVAKVAGIPEDAATLPKIDRSPDEAISSIPDLSQTKTLPDPIAPATSVPISGDRPLVVQAKFTSESTPIDPPLTPLKKEGDRGINLLLDQGTQKSGSEPTGLSDSRNTRFPIKADKSTSGSYSASGSLELSRELPTVETTQQQDAREPNSLPMVESQRFPSQSVEQKRETEPHNPLVETLTSATSVPISGDRPLVVQAKFTSESTPIDPPLAPLKKEGDRGINLLLDRGADPVTRVPVSKVGPTQNSTEKIQRRSPGGWEVSQPSATENSLQLDRTEESLPVVQVVATNSPTELAPQPNSFLKSQDIAQKAIAQTPNPKTDLPIVSSRPLPNPQQFSQPVSSSSSMEMTSETPVSPKADKHWSENIETPLLLSVSPTKLRPRAEINNVADLTVRSPDMKLGQGKRIVGGTQKPAVSQQTAIDSNGATPTGDRAAGNTSETQTNANIDLEALTSKIERKLMRRLAIEKERRGQGRWR